EWTIPLDKAMLGRDAQATFRGPWKLAVSAEVREEGGRAVTAATTSDLDMLPWYIGVRPRRDGVATPGRPATVEFRLITPPGTPGADSISRKNPEKVELVVLPESAATAAPADGLHRTFKVGERAQVLVKSPFAGRLLLTVETDRVLETRVLEMPASHVTVPIE